jgi:hypothetical protein
VPAEPGRSPQADAPDRGAVTVEAALALCSPDAGRRPRPRRDRCRGGVGCAARTPLGAGPARRPWRPDRGRAVAAGLAPAGYPHRADGARRRGGR